MKSWTRTLNMGDAHIILRLAKAGTTRRSWERDCTLFLEEADRSRPLTIARRNDLLRIIRVSFLAWEGKGRDAVIADNLFLRFYHHPKATPSFQEELVDIQWALYNDLARVAIGALVVPFLGDEVPISTVDAFVDEYVDSKRRDAPDSLRKTRTVLIKALELAGTIRTSGQGRHRRYFAQRAEPHPMTFAYLLLFGLGEAGENSISYQNAVSGNFAMHFTQCGVTHAFSCVGWALKNNVLSLQNGQVAA